jgi:Sulfatase-modifying factor enzyme 1
MESIPCRADFARGYGGLRSVYRPPGLVESKAVIARLVAPNLARMRSTCFSMVRGLTLKANPIWRLVEPRASQESTSHSREVRQSKTRLRYGSAALLFRFEERRLSRGKPFDPAGRKQASLIPSLPRLASPLLETVVFDCSLNFPSPCLLVLLSTYPRIMKVAERPLNPADFPGAPDENLVPGSMVFQKTKGPVDLRNYANWWRWTPGANWRHPRGPSEGLERHPAVHVAYEDAETYAKWAEKDLPTEAEWEYAARGGIEGARSTWGDEHFPSGKAMANAWQATSRGKTSSWTVMRELHRSAPSRQTVTGCTTWLGTSGNGHAECLALIH